MTPSVLRSRVLLAATCVGALFAACVAGDRANSSASSRADSQEAADSVSSVSQGDAVRGLALLTAFGDSLPGNRGNGLRCTSCHLDNGTRETALPWLGSAARYPQYRARPGYSENMERRINECIARSLAGKMIPEAGRDMRDMVAYMESLRERSRPAEHEPIKLVGNVASGRDGYVAQCARCHGAAGEGVVGLAPAVWGAESYSVGAGMARQFTMATFLRHNMPYDRATVLTDQQAADIAAYVLTQPRQDHPGKERDWPKGDPPADVAYATDSARAAGKPMPAARPLLPRRVSPDSLSR
ncbi:MAG: c-type cytochrome [Gemmatimonadaceae bacterium]|nr:c-type cytochrome [Gemmatimonadaceae bacterium]